MGEDLIELDRAGGYVLLANAYASKGEWTNVARVRKMMKERDVKKMPGWSRIEVGMRSHLFFDSSHPPNKEIYEMLDELPLMKKRRCLLEHVDVS